MDDVKEYAKKFFRKKSERPASEQQLEEHGDFFDNLYFLIRQTAEMIEWRLQKCGSDLTQKLNYTREEAETVLAGAIAYYLDERFSITNRELLGFD
ncbi:hypothetical protein [Desulfonema magnum]|uniref:Uncharacterized protein n=1 Tax=Desulfonema magnum TaxID=45655 RepID=A0A975BU28_9BACT|nr:hypothetical protein [Desulfonema magnum]QTA91835.1 Uncharacterized protein dnm_079090 [Desulfonema magnum]